MLPFYSNSNKYIYICIYVQIFIKYDISVQHFPLTIDVSIKLKLILNKAGLYVLIVKTEEILRITR